MCFYIKFSKTVRGRELSREAIVRRTGLQYIICKIFCQYLFYDNKKGRVALFEFIDDFSCVGVRR